MIDWWIRSSSTGTSGCGGTAWDIRSFSCTPAPVTTSPSTSTVEHLNVLFEDVRAVKLRSSYRPLILRPANGEIRSGMLDFGGIPAGYRHRYLALILPSPPSRPGFILCARAAVLAVAKTDQDTPPGPWAPSARVIHQVRSQDHAT